MTKLQNKLELVVGTLVIVMLALATSHIVRELGYWLGETIAKCTR